MLSILAAAAVVALADPAPVAEGHGGAAPASATAAAAAPAKPSALERICWDEAPTGSHFTKHYCATREELEQRTKQDQEAISNKGHSRPPAALSAGH